MKKWTKTIEINAPIERVWAFLDGSLEKMQQIMPQVIEHYPIKVTDEVVGSVYRQKYQEGTRMMEYDVETLEYADTPDTKRLKVGFRLGDLFEITASYELIRIDENHTRFIYTTTNRALKWYVKLLLLMANQKVVVEFVNRVKNVAETAT